MVLFFFFVNFIPDFGCRPKRAFSGTFFRTIAKWLIQNTVERSKTSRKNLSVHSAGGRENLKIDFD